MSTEHAYEKAAEFAIQSAEYITEHPEIPDFIALTVLSAGVQVGNIIADRVPQLDKNGFLELVREILHKFEMLNDDFCIFNISDRNCEGIISCNSALTRQAHETIFAHYGFKTEIASELALKKHFGILKAKQYPFGYSVTL
jgi:hypothetical protein